MFWNRLVHQPPKQRPWERLRGIRDYAYGHPSRLPRLSTWKLFGKLAGFDIDDLERHVTMLRTSSGRYTRTVEQVNLPFSLSTIPGARLIGYQGDANSRNAAFSNRDPVLHADYADCVRRVVGEITIRNTNLHRGGFGAGDYARTNVGELVTILVGVTGFDNSLDQKLANNPLPLWLNVSTDSLIAACLSALWDAEGSVNFRDLKLGQAVPLPPQLSKYLPNWPENVPFRQVPVEIQTTISRGPPLLLVSSALFLRRLGIPSHLTPTKASMTSTGPTAYWLLRIHQDESIRTFRRRIGLMSPSKRKSLEAIR